MKGLAVVVSFVALATGAADAGPKRPPAPPRAVRPAPRPSGPVVAAVVVEGNARVEEDAIRVHLKVEPGQPYERERVDQDLRAVYAMGFFEQVTVETQANVSGGVTIIYRLRERPFVRKVKVDGTDTLKREEVEAALRVRPNTILDPEKARQGIEAARKLYADKGRLDARIDLTTASVGNNEVDATYTVDEGKPIRIKDIEFEGNATYSDRKLRGFMQTKERSPISYFTGAGNLNKDVLRADAERLTAWYYDNGYVTVRVDEPQVARNENSLTVTIKIDEGQQFTVGPIHMAGENLPGALTTPPANLPLVPGEVFRASAMRETVQQLTERLSDDGFAFATVEPATQIDPDKKTVEVTFEVDRGKPVVVDRIDVTGNTKTRDEVVRREMRLQEQELFSGSKLRRSRDSLQRLGFFQEVNVTTRKGASDDRMNVVVDVKEGQTGSFSAGAGFSSADSLIFNARIQENNLFGRGQRLVLNADVGSIRRNIVLSFTEPYFLRTPLTLGFDAFSWQLRFDDFDRSGTGMTVSAAYPVTAWGFEELWGFSLDNIRAGLDYRIEQANIDELDFNATRAIRIEEGKQTISSLTPRITRNTLNHAFDPTAGSAQEMSVEVAGIGGVQFLKAEARSRWYYTFLRSKRLGDFTYSLGATVGWGVGTAGLNGDQLPLFERYFPGGITSIRGFEPRTLGPREFDRDTNSRRLSSTPIGGSKLVVLNNEIIFPLVSAIGMKGVVFVDAGNAYARFEDIDSDHTRLAAGLGVRWLSPLGPLRVEVGQPFNTKRGDQKSVLLFSFGGPFQF